MWAVLKSLIMSLAVDIVRDWRRDRALRDLGYTEAERDAARKDADAWRNRPRSRADAVDRLRRAADAKRES